MHHKKDYVYSLNKGLFNNFQKRHVVDLFDLIKEIVRETEKIPDDNEEQLKWVCNTVNFAVNGKFKTHLVKQIMKSIQNAPSLDKDFVYDDF